MEGFGNSLNQSMAEIFENKSPLAKKREKLNQQITDAKEFIKMHDINQILENKEEIDFETVKDYLNIFYKGSNLDRQITILEKNKNTVYLITRMYGILTHRIDELQKIKDEIQEITK